MKARTCCLCGGKVRNGRCVECGMNNSRTDADIRVNQNDDSRGFIPRMTAQEMNRQAMARDRHVEANVRTQVKKTTNQKQQVHDTQTAQRQAQTHPYTARTSRKAQKKPNFAGLVILLVVAFTVIGNVADGITSWRNGVAETKTEAVPDTEAEIYTLEASQSEDAPERVYVAGADFSVGTYDLYYVSGSENTVKVFHDNEEYDYYLSEDEYVIEGIELYEGDQVISLWGETALVSE